MSQPIRSSVRTYSGTRQTGHRPVLAEAIEGRQMFAAGPHPHNFGPPDGHWGSPRADAVLVMPLTAVALYRAAAAMEAAAGETVITTQAVQSSQATRAVQAMAAVRSTTAEPGTRAVPVTAVAIKPAEVTVTHADIEAVLQTAATPTEAVKMTAESTSLSFGPFNVVAAMAAPTTAEPKLTWVASNESSVLRPEVTPAAAGRQAVSRTKTVQTMPTEVVVVDAVETQQAVLGLPTEAVADRPLWQRISAALAGATLVAVNYVARRRRRQVAAAIGSR